MERAKESYEKLKGLEGAVNPQSEEKLKKITETAKQAMLDTESKSN